MRTLALLAILLTLIAPMVPACTGVVIAREGQVLVGGNEDWTRWDSYMWATPPSGGRIYGAVYFGYEIRGEWGHVSDFWYEFQGVNEQGLYFDSFGAPCDFPETTQDNPNRGFAIMVDAMESCATVAEAVALFERSNLAFMQCQQFLFVDKHGAAAVVEGDETVWMEGDTLALTNFYLSNPSLGNHPCWRYSRVMAMLHADATPSEERVVQLLDAASHAGTRYSVICNLTEGTAQLSFAHNFLRLATLDILKLCTTGHERIPISELVENAESAR